MADPTTAPFGSWASPITSDLIATAAVNLVDVLLDGGDVYWVESRPSEPSGRYVLVRRGSGGGADVNPAPFNVRTRVHEYGGAAAVVAGGVAYCSNFNDQRLYRIAPGAAPAPLTPAPPTDRPDAGLRYADGLIDRSHGLWVGVREDHRDPAREAVNTLVAVDLAAGGEGTLLVGGNDFYSSPRLSPDGGSLAWLTWNHPNMPWVGTELWVAEFTGGGVGKPQHVAGGPGESIFQPEWSPDGRLYFVSDRTGWWNLYRREPDGKAVNVCPREAEFGQAQWVFGMATYAFLSAERMICTYTESGVGRLALLDLASGRLTPFDRLPFTEFSSVRAGGGTVALRVGSPVSPAAIVTFDPETGTTTTLRRATEVADDPKVRPYLTTPRAVVFPTTGGKEAHGLFYPPHNPDFAAPDGERPPLLVKCHGGPTGAASSILDLRTQFWTSRGIAVLDVDYGGSTGYGRAYRDRLYLNWGVVDVDDCVAAAGYAAAQGLADPARAVITGGSAGGYTALACLTFRNCFRAGGSHYGVSDLEALVLDTHKFEARYLDWLVGPYPAARDVYVARAPVHHADRLGVPVAFFQGSEDRIVPPNQTELMVAALRRKGVPVAYLLFAGEQHGFRQAANIKRALDAELYFYAALAFQVGLRF